MIACDKIWLCQSINEFAAVVNIGQQQLHYDTGRSSLIRQLTLLSQ